MGREYEIEVGMEEVIGVGPNDQAMKLAAHAWLRQVECVIECMLVRLWLDLGGMA